MNCLRWCSASLSLLSTWRHSASSWRAVELNPSSLPQSLWSAAATSLLAALLMLSQRSLKRLLVLSTIEDAGFLLLGLASLTY